VKTLSAVIVALALLTAPPASAQTKVDLSTITCKQFLAMGKDTIFEIMMWMAGYYADQDAPPIIDFGKMKEDLQKLSAYCQEHSDVGLITAAEETIAE
jgi:acid stress chaperone HdeB